MKWHQMCLRDIFHQWTTDRIWSIDTLLQDIKYSILHCVSIHEVSTWEAEDAY